MAPGHRGVCVSVCVCECVRVVLETCPDCVGSGFECLIRLISSLLTLSLSVLWFGSLQDHS